MGILAGIAGLVSLGCWIFVLIQMFPKEGALKGILAIICGLYAFIWGWMNRDADSNMQNVMIAWTVAIVIGMVANGGAAASSF